MPPRSDKVHHAHGCFITSIGMLPELWTRAHCWMGFPLGRLLGVDRHTHALSSPNVVHRSVAAAILPCDRTLKADGRTDSDMGFRTPSVDKSLRCVLIVDDQRDLLS